MQDVTLRVAVVSADTAFRSAVAEVLRSHPEMATVISDNAIFASALTADVIDRVQSDQPEIVLVDLSGDPAGGMRMVRLLGDAAPSRTLVGTGPSLAPELLLEAMKAGITEYLPSPVDAHDLADTLRRAARRLGRAGAYTHTTAGRVVSFVGAKGGAGVTTAIANAALYMHRPEQKTLLLDLHLESGSVAVAMGLKPRYSVLDLLENFHRVDESLLSSLVLKHESGVHVLCGPLLPETVPAIAADQMRAVLRLLRRHYDLIVVDVGRPYSEHGRVALDSADAVILMLVPDVLAIHNAKRLLPLIRKGVESRGGKLHLVLNRLGPADEIQKNDIEEALDIKVELILRRDDVAVLSSLNLGRPLALNGGRSRYARDVKHLSAVVSGNAAIEAPTGVSRLLRGLGRRGDKS